MKIKKEFLIKGKQWKVEYRWGLRDESGHLCEGICDFESRTIFLRREISIEDKWLAFLHELIHATLRESHVTGSSDGAIDLVNEGIICEAFSDVLNSLFKFRWKRAA